MILIEPIDGGTTAVSISCYRTLLLSDFDNSMALTIKHPNGIDVEEGYRRGIKYVFGQRGLDIYVQSGGLQNRSAGQVPYDLINDHPELLEIALANIEQDIPRIWRKKDPMFIVTEMLIEYKLRLLEEQIGFEWPMPCNGFLEFAETIGRHDILDLGIITSGHQRFIERWLSLYNIPCQIMLTDDEMRNRSINPTKKFKPHPHGLKLLLGRWQRLHCQSDHLSRVVYFGDDDNKDGQLAINSNLPFGWFTDKPGDIAHFPRGSFRFNDWRIIADHISEHEEDFRRGIPCADIFESLQGGGS